MSIVAASNSSDLKGSIARAVVVLDALTNSPGATMLAQIARSTGFSKSTTHRILSSLVKANYVIQEPGSRAYRLGTTLAELGKKARHQEVTVFAAPMLERLAELSNDTVFVSIPEGASVVCVDRKVGSFPIKSLTLERGDRRPLGVGAGSLALYCAMPETVRKNVCEQNRGWMSGYGNFGWHELEKSRLQFQEAGYALNRGGIVQGMSAVAVPVLTRSGRAAASFSIAAINERMLADRIEKLLVPALKQASADLAIALSAHEEHKP